MMGQVHRQEFGAVSASGERLLAFVAGLGVRFGMERSVKFRRHEVAADRFLLSLARAGSPVADEAGFRAFAGAIGMPADLVEEAAAKLKHADLVHLGHETDRRGTFRKLYLEFAGAFRRARPDARRNGRSLPVYTAWKWDPAEPERRATTHYLCPPVATQDEVAAFLPSLFAGRKGDGGLRLGLDLLAEASRRTTDDLLLLLVRETETPRMSFDLNLYPAEMRLRDAAPALAPLFRDFGVESEAADLLDRDGGADLGHVAAGAGRESEAFVTVYFGVEGR